MNRSVPVQVELPVRRASTPSTPRGADPAHRRAGAPVGGWGPFRIGPRAPDRPDPGSVRPGCHSLGLPVEDLGLDVDPLGEMPECTEPRIPQGTVSYTHLRAHET